MNNRKKNSNSNNKSQSEDNEGTFLTQPPNKNKTPQVNPDTEKIQEQIQKQAILLKQINDAEQKLKIAQEQRKKLITTKKKDIEMKDQTINQMRAANDHLQKELDILQTQVEKNFDSAEYKEKNEKFEQEKKKREEPLLQIINVKKKQLSEIVQKSNKFRKEKEDIQKDLEQKVDLEQINKLTSEIKLTQEKIDDLEKEKKYLLQQNGEHSKCEEENTKIRKEIEEIKNELEKLRKENKQKSKIEQKNQSMKIKEINHYLTDKQIKEKNQQRIKNAIDKYWQKNKNLLDTTLEEENKIMKTSPSNTDKKIAKKQKMKNYTEEVLKKNIDINQNSQNNDKLPIIPLFKEKEKQILLGILPEKELNKYERRFEYVEKEKNNLLRQYNVENKQFKKENKDLENKYEFSNNQLNEGAQKNKMLENQLIEQQKQFEQLTNKLAQIKKNISLTKIEVRTKDEENKNLINKLKRLQKIYQNVKGIEIENNENTQRYEGNYEEKINDEKINDNNGEYNNQGINYGKEENEME